MALTFAVTGATSYQYRPATPQENTPRVVLEVAVAGIMAEAMVDTGGVYLLCHPRLARQLDIDASQAVSPVIELLFRGVFLQGQLHRLPLTLLAEEGENLAFEATAFVPEQHEEEGWSDMPSILGFYGCLERIRMAIDPVTETFYFGSTG
jgi:hypothetical protein